VAAVPPPRHAEAAQPALYKAAVTTHLMYACLEPHLEMRLMPKEQVASADDKICRLIYSENLPL